MNVKDKPRPCGGTTRAQASDGELVSQGTEAQEDPQTRAQGENE